MKTPFRLHELLAKFSGSPDEIYDVEYLGRFRVSGDLTLRIVDERTALEWRRSVVPDEYIPLYGLKCGPPEYAGGLFDAAPFAAFDPNDLQYKYLNLPSPTKPIYDLCRDRYGCPFWVSADAIVFGLNQENEMQRIGALSDFVDFAIDLAIDGISWYERLNDSEATSRFRLTSIRTMG